MGDAHTTRVRPPCQAAARRALFIVEIGWRRVFDAEGAEKGTEDTEKDIFFPARRLPRFCVSGDNHSLSPERRPDYATDPSRTARRAIEGLQEA